MVTNALKKQRLRFLISRLETPLCKDPGRHTKKYMVDGVEVVQGRIKMGIAIQLNPSEGLKGFEKDFGRLGILRVLEHHLKPIDFQNRLVRKPKVEIAEHNNSIGQRVLSSKIVTVGNPIRNQNGVLLGPAMEVAIKNKGGKGGLLNSSFTAPTFYKGVMGEGSLGMKGSPTT